MQHYRGKHSIDKGDMEGHYIYQQAMAEKAAAKAAKKGQVVLTAEEQLFVGLAYLDSGEVDEKCYNCLKCPVDSKPLTKREAEHHMRTRHKGAVAEASKAQRKGSIREVCL